MIKTIRYSLFAVFLIAPFINGLKDPTPIFVFETVVFIIFLISTFKNFNLRKTGVDTPILLFVIFVVFSTINTLYLDSSINIILLLISYIAFFYCVIAVYDNNLKKKFYVGLICISAVLSMIILFQIYSAIIPKATMPNPNMAAGYIAAGASLLFALLILGKNNTKALLIYSLLFLLFCVAVVLTHSRGGLFALLCGIVAVLYIKFKTRGLVYFIAGLLAVFILLPRNSIINIAKIDGNDIYTIKRPAIWKSAFKIIEEKPILGTGPGNFELLFGKYNFPAGNSIARYYKTTGFAHNEFLQIASEGGLFSLFAFLFVLFIIFKEGLKTSPIPTAVLASVIGQSFVDFNLHLPSLVIAAIFLSSDIFYKSYTGTINLNVKYVRLLLLSILVFNIFNFVVKPFNAEKYISTGNTFIKTEPFKALNFYKKADKYSPNDFEYKRITGELYFLTRDTKDAIENIKESIELNPKNPFAVGTLANIYYALKENNKAAYYALKALDIEPNYLVARYLLAETSENQNKVSVTLQEYDNIVSVHNKVKDEVSLSNYEKTLLDIDVSSVYNSAGLLQLKNVKFSDAIRDFELSLEVNPKNAQTYSNLASVYFIQKNYQNALKYAKLAESLEPNEPNHIKNLILIYQKLGNNREIKKLNESLGRLEK